LRWSVLLFLAACESAQPASMIVPGQVRRALSQLTDLEATAELVASDGTRAPPVALERANDGVSFSGFLPAEPGDYQLEVAFRGKPVGRNDVLFLGRWTSDGFSIRAGTSANPAFARPLDTIGRPEDGGDPDGDGFGNLDEIIWGTDPGTADSDGDGVPDGDDCAPRDMAGVFPIMAGGSIEDCDGDGARRPDVPFGGGGNDCDDRDPAIHPGVQDDCNDGVDSDCNPSTCPSNDVTSPVITAVDPPGGSTIGCQTRVRATVTDDGVVAAASLYLDEPVPGMPLTYFMTRESGDEFVSPSLNSYVSYLEGLIAGSHPVQIRAQDNGGNMTEQTVDYDFVFEVPEVTSMTPLEIGSASAPFTVEVQASAPRGVALLRLMAVKRSGGGTYNTDTAIEIGRAASGAGSFEVDPAALGEGEHLLYPVVSDPIGNELRPPVYAFPIGGVDGLEMDSDYSCIATASLPKLPARVVIVGQNAYAPATMRELLAEAISQAAATDPDAALVQIVGIGIRADGKVGLDDAASFSKRWTFGFYNAAAMRWMSVAWFTPAFATTNPVVDPDDGSITSIDPIPNPAALVDSPEAVDAYVQAGCPQLQGTDSDYILYQFLDGQAAVSFSHASGAFWRGTATAPITQILACN
jgi:hypothetical protein